MTATPPRQQLIEAIARLNEQQIRLILQFIQTLQPKPSVAIAPTPTDPLAGFIGANHHGSLASAIDDTLYG